jgi:DNA polymerase III delta prime subunit
MVNMGEVFPKKMKKYLDRLAQSPKRPSSFLFFGAGDEEKTEAAFYFIQKISKKAGDEEFSERIRSGAHPDVVVIEPETVEDKKGRTREKEITIDQVRKAQGHLKYFPYELKYKFCLIKKSQKLNAESSNALLKILEEPTASTIFILLASGVDSVLPTIASRCAALRFSKTELPSWSEENRKRLREIFVEEIHEKFGFAEKISKDKSGAIEILKDWEAVMADSLRNLAGKESQAEWKKARKIAAAIRENREAINKMENSNASPRSILENLLLGLQWK